MVTKVLFLDCDGVINSHETFERRSAELKVRRAAGALTPHEVDRYVYMCDDDKVASILALCERTGTRIVVSSVWRMNMRRVREIIPDTVLHPTEPATRWRVTDDPRETRGTQVDDWLKRHPEVVAWAGVDDDRDFHPHQLHRMVFTDGAVGLTANDLEALAKLLEDSA